MTKVRTGSIVVNTALLDSTDTNLNGILKGSAGKVAAATPDIDYATPASVGQKVSKTSNLSDLADRQTSLNNLGGAGTGNGSKVLTQDPADGNIKLMTPAASGGSSDVLTYDFPLNETITADKIVQVLATGKIESVKSVAQTETIPNGSGTDYQTTGYMDAVVKFDPNNANRFVVAFTEMFNYNYGAIRAGTISGSTLTFGPKLTFRYADTQTIDVDFFKTPANTVIIAYKDNGVYGYGTAVVATIASDLSITTGTAVVFNSQSMLQVRVVSFASMEGQGVIAVQPSSSWYVFCHGFKVSGTSVSFGTQVSTYVATTNADFSISASKKDPIALISHTYSSSAALTPIYLDGATQAVTFGTRVDGTGGKVEVDRTGVTNNFIAVYLSTTIKAKTGTLSYASTTPIVTVNSTENVIVSRTAYVLAIAGDNLTSGKLLMTFKEFVSSAYHTKAVTLTVNGEVVSPGTERTVVAANPSYRSTIAISSGNPGQVLIEHNGKLYAGLMGLEVSNINKTNIVGFLKTGGVANDSRTVKLLGGVIGGFTGLTPGTSYYIQPNGTVSTSATDSRCLYLGKAISATAILTKQNL